MALPKHQQIDLRGNELLVTEITSSTPVDAGNIAVTAPGTDATWVDVQTALNDIAARLAVLEA